MLVTFLSLLVSTVVAIWGIYQTRITSRLQVQVHRLAVNLDQNIKRLEHARELIANLQSDFYTLLTLSRDMNPKLTIENEEFLQLTLEKMYTTATRTNTNTIELIALAKVISDQQLINIVTEYQSINITSPLTIEFREIDQIVKNLNEISTKAYIRIYQLLELTSEDQL